MRRISILAGLVVAVAVAISATSASAGQPFQHATGGVTLGNPTQYLEFNAFDYGGGATPDRGTVNYSNPSAGVSYQASVYCAVVSGNTASFGYVIPAGTGSGLDGLRIIWTVTDGGSPGAGHDTAGFAVLSPGPTSRADCSTPPSSFYPVTDGNLVVH
jgi:hypothetical protein